MCEKLVNHYAHEILKLDKKQEFYITQSWPSCEISTTLCLGYTLKQLTINIAIGIETCLSILFQAKKEQMVSFV